MTLVVVYESMYGNTHKSAEAIGHGLTEAGAPVDVDPSAQGEGVREWQGTLGAGGGRPAAFDTRAKGPAVLTGRASQVIVQALRLLGYALVAEPESFLVSSANQLLPAEDARDRRWGVGLATRI